MYVASDRRHSYIKSVGQSVPNMEAGVVVRKDTRCTCVCSGGRLWEAPPPSSRTTVLLVT